MDSISIHICWWHASVCIVPPWDRVYHVWTQSRGSVPVSQTSDRWWPTTSCNLLTVKPRPSSCALLSSNRDCRSHSLKLAPPSSEVRNIGAFLDQGLNMQHHVQQLCQSGSFRLWSIGRVRHLLIGRKDSWEAGTYLHLDFGNAHPYGIPESLLVKLQHNTEYCSSPHRHKNSETWTHHSGPEALHWLPVVYRTDHKLLLLTFRTLYMA